jgi:hypothetical protein
MSDELIRSTFSTINSKLQNCSFSIFYSNPWQTLKKGCHYIAGLNPGGNESTISDTYEWWTKEVGPDKPWSAYLDDEKWPSRFQPNMKEFAEAVWGDCTALRDKFSTNAIFERSRDREKLSQEAISLFDVCWLCHEQFLDVVRPEVIIALSNAKDLSAFSLFKTKLQSERSLGGDVKVYGRFSIKGVEGTLDLPSGPLPVRLVGLPHPSRCKVTAQGSPALNILKDSGWL